jgi:lipopolysaccharide/colanic/teichoic acid biosynthesis glycosyltransferase
MLRAFDLIIAISALVFFAPIMTIVAIVVKLEDGGPILFGHKRVGEGGQSFKCLKFRSMRTNAAELLRNILETEPSGTKIRNCEMILGSPASATLFVAGAWMSFLSCSTSFAVK